MLKRAKVSDAHSSTWEKSRAAEYSSRTGTVKMIFGVFSFTVSLKELEILTRESYHAIAIVDESLVVSWRIGL